MMMVHATGGRRGGNLEVDRQITQLGATRDERRIRGTIGSKDAKRLRRANAIIDKLVEDEEWDLLRALRDGDVTFPQLLAADRKDKTKLTLNRVKLQAYLWDRVVPDAAGVELIEPGAVSRALSRVKGARTRARYIDSFEALQRKAAVELPADAPVDALADIDYDALYARWGTTNADWMHLRRALSRFATLHIGDKYAHWARNLRTAIPTKKVKKRRPNISIETFIAITQVGPPHAAAAFWALAITGVRVGEYLASGKEHLDARSHTYDVPGTKTDGSAAPIRIDPRWWIYLERAIPSRLGYKWLREYWARACVEVGLGRMEPTGEMRRARKKLETGQNYSRRGHRAAGQVEHEVTYEMVPVIGYVGPTLHDLRHCHGQWAINAGVAESKVQGSLRHENAAQTRDYVMQAGTLDVSAALANAILGMSTPIVDDPARKNA